MFRETVLYRFYPVHLCPGLNASSFWIVLHIWQGCLSFSYYFIFDKIVCVLVTFYQWGHFVMLIMSMATLPSRLKDSFSFKNFLENPGHSLVCEEYFPPPVQPGANSTSQYFTWIPWNYCCSLSHHWKRVWLTVLNCRFYSCWYFGEDQRQFRVPWSSVCYYGQHSVRSASCCGGGSPT